MKTKLRIWGCRSIQIGIIVNVLFFGVSAARADVTPPDLTVCDGVGACDAPLSECDAGGFLITLTNYTPAPPNNTGSASYTYSICAPALDGICSNNGNSCQDHQDCWTNKCQNGGPHAGTCDQDDTTPCTDVADCNIGITCSGDCRVDKFQGLSHTDVFIPDFNGLSCVGLLDPGDIDVVCNSPARGTYAGVIGDGSCAESDSPVAKCDDPQLGAGQCLTMTIVIPGELNSPGLGAVVAVDKPGPVCLSSCIAGPSCDPCIKEEGEACLTRTIGFWGNHPWITNDYDPVTVCGKTLGCSGPDDGKSNPACLADSCTSIMEGLCSNPGNEGGNNPAYITMVRQLTAANLNLNATAANSEGGTCSTWSYKGKTIQEWISFCEGLCGASKSVISNSGCIEALDAFNNSLDTGFDVTPPGFDHPPVDDHDNISGADPSQCNLAQGNNKKDKWVIGKNVGGHNCQ